MSIYIYIFTNVCVEANVHPSVWKPSFSQQVLDKPQFSSYCLLVSSICAKIMGHLRGLPFHVDRMIQNSSFGKNDAGGCNEMGTASLASEQLSR